MQLQFVVKGLEQKPGPTLALQEQGCLPLGEMPVDLSTAVKCSSYPVTMRFPADSVQAVALHPLSAALRFNGTVHCHPAFLSWRTYSLPNNWKWV